MNRSLSSGQVILLTLSAVKNPSHPSRLGPQVEQTPNLVIKITREPQWSQLHPTIMGPNNSFFYFGPSITPGYVVYGNGPSMAMSSLSKQKKEGSTYVLSFTSVLDLPRVDRPDVRSSRYYTGQNGKEYKWKISAQRMEVRRPAALCPPSNLNTL
jgi:hypothetical protein